MKTKENKSRKILQIKKGEYLLEIRNNAVATTYNKDVAMDISNWSLEQLGFIAGNLKKVGYDGVSVITIEDSMDNEKVKKDGEGK